MTIKGIDVAWPQASLDLGIPWSQGFVVNYVKLGGDNDGRYVAQTYPGFIDRSRPIGYRCGHYWVPNDAADPVSAADFYCTNLRGWTARDFAVLDNENLDGAVRYGDAKAAAWIERVKVRKSIPGRQVFVYTNLSDARSITWDRVLATGAMFIIAAPSYGPMQFPDIPTIPRNRIVGHQYGTVSFGGVTTDVDVFTDTAFSYGGGSMALEQKMREFAALYPTPASHPSGGDGSWDQDCGRVMFRFASFLGWLSAPVGDISSAYRAYQGSRIEGTTAAGAPLGAYHWFDVGGVDNGHVMQQADTNTLVFGGTAKVWEDLGVDIGFMSVQDYLNKTPDARYLGWSRDYSGGRPNLASTAGGDVTPIVNIRRSKTMRLVWAESTGYLVTEDGFHGLPSPQVYNLFYRLINSDQSKSPFVNGGVPDNFNRAEIDIMKGQLTLLRVGNGAQVNIDPVKLASAIADALNASGKLNVTVTVENLADAKFTVDPEALAAAFDAAVPRVAKAILREAGTAFGSIPQ